MPNLNTVELKAFVPSRDFALSQDFYQDIGFERKSVGHGVAYSSPTAIAASCCRTTISRNSPPIA
ncbi:hypothetical protein [Chromobacterium sp. ATCC 53434]|uniref:hypothetical protein n=1 Tax=Chromobacterium sp. (strain ATCC 53434 / SC 14030) TaxID=2059672 RepID=UPI0018F15D40|nr:hypothetical protein [Chromobacterium sp. ATCC 53434]